ncbi:ATP-binding cassette domain-containing protein [Salipiger sp. IMCC34102]|uniref:ATP-binding cassette domain-containing protein n=1 Tax=Salipiger sp. IMCC34102 TaxID=2510647 RepID=UPI00101DABD8|nr:ATP-binding cassette domain-containing protein [Salipiger sp. IMCC34102]RYH02611.1 ATP-binding cassette domain-containing protein [Salipiger sp. IMCC34102]
MIEIQNLTIQRGETTTLADVTLRFGQGGITALIGPNGAGKSTLLHAMTGLLPPARGTVTIEGHDMARARAADRARTVALLTQSENVTARLSVRDLVSFGRWPHHQGRPGDADRAMIETALDLFDLSDLAERPIDTLSGGQRQRAFVAMAYAQETPWMLLDEPLAALDPRHARDLMERLHAMSRPGAHARSIVVVLHDLGMAARYADRIVALKDGRLVTSGPRPIALTGRVLTDLFDTGLEVRRVGGTDIVVPV